MEQHSKLHAILSSAIDLEKYELVGIEMVGGMLAPNVRIYVDTKVGNITIDEISVVSKQMKAVLDVSGFFTKDYHLEVSSPGLDRPLFTLAQFREQIGQKVNLKSAVSCGGRHNFKGVLKEVSDDKITLLLDESQSVVLSLSDIAKAKLISDIDFGQKHRKHGAKK